MIQAHPEQVERAATPVGTPAVAFETVYRQYVARVARWAARLGSPMLDPEDVTHDVFLKLQSRWGSLALSNQTNLEAFLFTMTANLVRTRRRVEKFRRWFRVPSDAGARVATNRPSPQDSLESSEARQLVAEALETLSDRDRQVLVLFELEGHTGTEVAHLLGLRADQIWVPLHRARKRFAEAVSKLERRSP